MNRANAAVLALARSLHPGDVLNLLTTDATREPTHRIAVTDDDPALFASDPPLTVSGAGDLNTAIQRAYKEAVIDGSLLDHGLNRVVVITDGAGVPASIDATVITNHWIDNRIQLVGVGVGLAPSYNQELLAAMTAAGHGPNLYLDSVAEAEQALHVRFDEVIDVAAGDLKIEVTLPTLFKIATANDAGVSVSAPELATSDLARGRSMVFRRVVRACPTLSKEDVKVMAITISALWTDADGAARKSEPLSVEFKTAWLDAPSIPMLKTSAITSFVSALSSLQVERFQAACHEVNVARKVVSAQQNTATTDPELESILTQIQAHPVMAGVPCP